MNVVQKEPAMKDPASIEVPSPPWWRVPMVWVVLSGPIAVVIASFVSAAVAWRHLDPVIGQSPAGALRAADDMSSTSDPKDPLAPALKARNHAALPRR
jgi:hypothetical protein